MRTNIQWDCLFRQAIFSSTIRDVYKCRNSPAHQSQSATTTLPMFEMFYITASHNAHAPYYISSQTALNSRTGGPQWPSLQIACPRDLDLLPSAAMLHSCPSTFLQSVDLHLHLPSCEPPHLPQRPLNPWQMLLIDQRINPRHQMHAKAL